MGDMNIDLNNYNDNSLVQRYTDELLSLNSQPYSIFPTHCNNDYHSVIDHVFATFGLSENNSSAIFR